MTEQDQEFTPSDPARRLRRVRETLRAETAKLPKADNHGKPLRPSSTSVAPTEPAEPIRRVPAPNPAQGSSASGAPDDRPDDLTEARKRGDWRTVMHLENQKIRAGQTERAPWDTVTPA